MLIFVAILGGAYYFFFSGDSCFDGKQNGQEEGIDCGGSSCVSCVLKNAKPLTISSVELFENNNKTVTVLGEVYNPNEKVGVKRLVYRVNLFDHSGKEVFSKTRETFVYPAKNRTLVEAGINLEAKNIDKVEIIFDEAVLQEERDFGDIPEKNITIDKIFLQTGAKEFVLSATLTNNNSFKIDKIIVKTVLLNKNWLKQNASLTFLESVEAFKSKDFSIRIPVKKEVAGQVDPTKTKVIFEVAR